MSFEERFLIAKFERHPRTMISDMFIEADKEIKRLKKENGRLRSVIDQINSTYETEYNGRTYEHCYILTKEGK